MARLLGLDPGAVRCGVAITDSDQTMAFPRPALANDASLASTLRALIRDEGVVAVVVGRPVALSGRATPSTRQADLLFDALVDALGGTSVIQWDERLTTVEAQRALADAGLKAQRQREHLDSAAAVIMLQHHLEGQRAR